MKSQPQKPAHRAAPAFQRKLASLAVAACFAGGPTLVLAGPNGATVVQGNATFNQTGNTLTVTNTPNTSINWQQFNINANETVRFNQQSATSAVLNRVVGGDPSKIYGTLQSNGQVYLINQNGILIGKGAQIDVNKFVASTLNLSDADFIAKRFNFSGGGLGSVINQGIITTPLGGSVWLVGPNVTNEGIITTPQGQVLLAAGNTVSVTDSAGPEVTVTLTADKNKALNLGQVTAKGGSIDIYGALVDQQGELKADSASVDKQGRIHLQATDSTTVSGSLSASNSAGQGGKIEVLGNNVTLGSTSSIDASGSTGGGTVLVGGDYQGKNAAVQNAENTTMAAGASIKADATQNGDGGKVVLWADGTTKFQGSISAQGGKYGGNGGFVETSGKRYLSLGGFVDTRAPLGKWGTWLLDPAAYCFSDAAGLSAACGSLVASGATAVSNLDVAAALNTSNITYAATDYAVIKDLTFSSYVTRPNATLTISAPYIRADDSRITVDGSVPINFYLKASGVSSTYSSKSGYIELASATGGIATGIWSDGGDILLSAEKHILLDSPYLVLDAADHVNGQRTTNGGVVKLTSPKIRFYSSASTSALDTTSIYGNGVILMTDKLSGRVKGEVSWSDIGTYTAGKDVLLDTSIPLDTNLTPADARCGTSALCLTGGMLNVDSHNLNIVAGQWSGFDKDSDSMPAINGNVYIQSNFEGYQEKLAIGGKNVVIGGLLYNFTNQYTTGSSSKATIEIFALETFKNTYSGNPFSLPNGQFWSIYAGDTNNSVFGSLIGNRLYGNLSDYMAVRGSLASNTIFGPNTAAVVDPCTLNPVQCTSTTPTNNASNTATTDSVGNINSSVTVNASIAINTATESPKINTKTMDRAQIAAILEQRREQKVEAFKEALAQLEANPGMADLPVCSTMTGDLCVPVVGSKAKGLSSKIAKAVPTEAALPEVERKVAVLFGIDDYADSGINPLEAAVHDVNAIASTLSSQLGYEVRVVRNPNKAEIIRTLKETIEQLDGNDSLMVYYAGHGMRVYKTGLGYWLPADSARTDPKTWVSNNDIARLLNATEARQVMLVADSCYSGFFTQEQKGVSSQLLKQPKAILKQRAVTVMSSGGDEEVSDEGNDGHSVFAWNFLQKLKNVEKYEAASMMYEDIKTNVSKDFPQTPQYGAITSARHQQGADYLFERRKYEKK